MIWDAIERRDSSMDDETITSTDLCKATRLEVIDSSGRAYVNWDVEALKLQLQDDGKTLELLVQW